MLATLADSALGCSVHTPARRHRLHHTTLGVTIDFPRPVTVATGGIRREGTALSVGRRTATATATGLAGRLRGHATTTCLVFPTGGEPPAGTPHEPARATDPTS